MTPRILLLDIETAPNVAHVWGLWNQNVGLNQLQATSYVMCWAAKWYGEKKVHFARVQYENGDPVGRREMLEPIHAMLDEADIVVHYNGTRFDIPTLQKEFLLHEMHPPAPFKQVDLLKVARKEFRFPSNKLEHVARSLKVGGKVKHAGHGLWVACMAGDETAWKQMARYNRGDVTLLERVYDRLMPWIRNHPNHALFNPEAGCPTCGSSHIQRRGNACSGVQVFARFQCQSCGSWFRGAKREGEPTEFRSVS